jgi:hypothetical protein
MKGDKNIVWLASYPKSGNTWMRSFLSALLTEKEPDINDMSTGGIFSGKSNLERSLDLDPVFLRQGQIEKFRRLSFSYLSDHSDKPLFVKIHDAFTMSEADGLPLVPDGPTKMAVYLIRNPLDVTLSLANHLDKDPDAVIVKFINNPAGEFAGKNTAGHQFSQILLNWSMHVESWKKIPRFAVHFVRYEDLRFNPFQTFRAAVKAMGLEHTDEQIQKAIDSTAFEKLKKKEQESGFAENMNPKSSFFYKGQVGRWKEELSPAQIQRIKEVHEPMMRAFGYWE